MTTPEIPETAITAARTAAVEFIQRQVGKPLSATDVAGAGEAALTAALPELHAAWEAGRVAIKREPCGETLRPDMPHRACVEPRGHDLHYDGNAVVWQIDGPRVRAQVLAEVEAALRSHGEDLHRRAQAGSAEAAHYAKGIAYALDYLRHTLIGERR